MSYYVFFDVDHTLVDWRVSWQDAFLQAAAEAGVHTTWEHASQVLGQAHADYYHECVARHCHGAKDLHEFWLDYDGHGLAMMGVTGDLRHYAGRIWDLLQHPDATALYPEVPEVLAALRARGAKLGVITDRPVASPDLHRLGIGHYFDPIIDAFAAGYTKPDPRIFGLATKAAARAGLPAWHIGDNYKSDVLGARAVGISPLLVDRAARYDGVDCPRITDLREVLDLLP